MDYQEIEFKYRADSISYSKFKEFCSALSGVIEVVTPSGQDIFYAKQGENSSFFRHRLSGLSSQITFKKKTTESDSFIRKEYNLDINPEHPDEFVESLLSELGYKKEFTLHKNSCVFMSEWFFLSYYICYDQDMTELGRFVELELREDVKYGSVKEAWDNLLLLEKLCRPLGVTPLGRIKQSLFEMYRPKSVEATVGSA